MYFLLLISVNSRKKIKTKKNNKIKIFKKENMNILLLSLFVFSSYYIFTVHVQGNDPSGMITSEILVKMYIVVLCII